MTGCLFFLYIGALGLPVSIQLHCLMLPYSMQTEDEEKGIYKGITGCMPLYAYAKEQVEADGQDLATTYILLEGRDESHEVLEAEDNLEETSDENTDENGSHNYGNGQIDYESDQPVSSEAAEDGTEIRELIHNFTGSGIIQGIHNTDKSISSFAHACFKYALDTKQDLWFATKDTISKKYDHNFKDIFQEIYDAEYAEQFKAAGIEYFYTLIDDAVARVMKAKGGFIWACKNYDGDVMSDMVSSAFGSLAMMTSVLVSPSGVYEYEAAHGTVQRHYYKYLKGEETSTNSVATIFAWTGALRKRGEMDKLEDLVTFANKLEKATIATIENGKMTKDLALITSLKDVTVLNSENFIKAIRETFDTM